MNPIPRTSNPAEPDGARGIVASADSAEMDGELIGRQGVRPISATFRRILVVALVIFAFAVVQMISLWAVCNVGMKTAASLEFEGLPTLNVLASLQENLVTYRLFFFEYLFAQEKERGRKANEGEIFASPIRSELGAIKTVFPP